ncbi:ABC transporter ATP-binding protein [Microbacterium sp.]|uniref:ABC transporter ATP-binding protein n=1 Tax=Microbacterium sp. TaxID=51671 RepID=UPI001AC09557|nr:ABC transporter ATP-binding protein [Microbacterium sp.]MBN9157269.1 ABC transporter ATP-binding protein [Microbacterium sp.]MBS1896453.1 ABC transporter ATP-binding protein [Actinomycetota bacterium]
MRSDLWYLIQSFPARDRLLLGLYVVLQFFVSLMDLVGLAAVLPLMNVLLGADMSTGYLGVISGLLGHPGRTQFVIILAAFMVLAFALKAVLSLAIQWWSLGLVLRLQVRTSSRMLGAFLNEDYLTHRQRDVAELSRTVDAAATDAHNKVLGGVLSLIASGLSIVMALALVIAVMPLPALAAIAYFGIAVFVMQQVLSHRNQRAGHDALVSARLKSLALIDAMHGFREVRTHGAVAHFVEAFDEANRAQGLASRRANFYSQMPRYLLEAVGMGGIALLIALVTLSGQSTEAVATLSLFIAATLKMLPLMSSLTATFGFIRNGTPGLAITVETLRRLPAAHESVTAAKRAPLARAETITVDRMSFRYPDGRSDVLSDIDFSIPPGSSLALCGQSGSGKTTLVDIILGLITTDRGVVSYGSTPVSEMGDSWTDIVAYVPQDVFLLHDTLAANVAFGQDPADRDVARIHDALARAQLTELVAALPYGIDSELGDRGSKISGGQRQRVGIARALYRSPQVIVFDEATSALDNETEDRIAATIRGLSGEITTILVAHRLSSVRDVDQLLFLEHGRVAGRGTFTEVQSTTPGFARLVELGRLDD